MNEEYLLTPEERRPYVYGHSHRLDMVDRVQAVLEAQIAKVLSMVKDELDYKQAVIDKRTYDLQEQLKAATREKPLNTEKEG